MKTPLILFFSLFATQIIVAQNLIEKYYKFGFNHSKTIEIYDNGTFFEKSAAVSCVIGADGKVKSSSREVYGTYEIQGDALLFVPIKELVKGYNDKEKIELKPTSQSLIYSILEWKDGKIYVMQNSSEEKFCSTRKTRNRGFVLLPSIPPFIKVVPFPDRLFKDFK